MKSVQLPPLYHRTKTGKLLEWIISVELTYEIPSIVTVFGYVGGVKQRTKVKVPEGKNLGKRNETTAWEQACLMARSKWEKQKLGNYRESLDEEVKLLPMLAHRYQDHKNKLTFPCYSQPKLDGLRVVALIKEQNVEYWSRKGKQYEKFHHWDEELKGIFPVGTILDGEAYHPNLGFQEIVRRVKRVKASRLDISHDPLQYWIYDTIQSNQTYQQRKMFLDWHIQSYKEQKPLIHLVQCPTTTIETTDELLDVHRYNTKEGFEGTILRSMTGLYKPDYRSYDLLKYKDFLDDEFKIVGGCSAQGRDEGTVIFECEVKPGIVFRVRPKGSFEQRKEYFDCLPTYIGKMLTVRYQQKSEDGIPIFPVGLGIRDFE